MVPAPSRPLDQPHQLPEESQQKGWRRGLGGAKRGRPPLPPWEMTATSGVLTDRRFSGSPARMRQRLAHPRHPHRPLGPGPAPGHLSLETAAAHSSSLPTAPTSLAEAEDAQLRGWLPAGLLQSGAAGSGGGAGDGSHTHTLGSALPGTPIRIGVRRPNSIALGQNFLGCSLLCDGGGDPNGLLPFSP